MAARIENKQGTVGNGEGVGRQEQLGAEEGRYLSCRSRLQTSVPDSSPFCFGLGSYSFWTGPLCIRDSDVPDSGVKFPGFLDHVLIFQAPLMDSPMEPHKTETQAILVLYRPWYLGTNYSFRCFSGNRS